ncbi:MAG: hypothetical protein ACREYC_03600, partial [Gammaproteobacteria bacterium]
RRADISGYAPQLGEPCNREITMVDDELLRICSPLFRPARGGPKQSQTRRQDLKAFTGKANDHPAERRHRFYLPESILTDGRL